MRPTAQVIDTHCHLDHFEPELLPDLLLRARAAGLGGMVTIGTRVSERRRQLELTALSSADLKIWCTIGTHPDHVQQEAFPDPEALAAQAADACVIGIGETGLDYLHDTALRLVQQNSFRAHIRAARIADVPVVIHARDADDDIIRILEEEHRHGSFRCLLHCFSSGLALAERAMALGASISFSGILTFPKSGALRQIACEIPLDRLLVETDAPYLAPVPRRGRRNEPSYVVHTAAVLADLRGLSVPALHHLTSQNFHRLFTKAA